MDPLVGLVVDKRYRIVSRIARGGMATVYRAQDERLDRPVAFKVMHPHLAESQDFVARFRREARSAARIVHPGVVRVYDQGIVHGQGFLVMELVEGPNLRSLLHNGGPLPVGRALSIAEQVLTALRAAHAGGVIHRDIKPENVLVPHDPPVRVTDFGLARAITDTHYSSATTMLGTVAYMAPEMATNGNADARTDIYSVGVMLFEMLTGQVPWDGTNAMQVAWAHVNTDIPLVSSLVEWIPREVDDVVSCLAARDPHKRPLDAAAAVELVVRALKELPTDVLNRHADAPKNLTALNATEPLPALDAVALSQINPTSALPMTRTSQVHVQSSGTPQAVTRSRNIRKRLVAVILVVLMLSVGTWWWWTQYGPGSYVTMPATVGHTEQTVISELQALGLASDSEQAFSDTVQSGLVISSDPNGEASVHKDARVKLVVSKGIDMKTVPNVVGQTQDQARLALTQAGLKVGTISEEWSENVPEGSVISQGSSAGSQLKHDSTVTIVISKGREPLSVPTLTGVTQNQAQASLEQLGLSMAATEQFSATVPQGQIISQDPAPHTTVHRGDTVKVVVSKGPEMVTVPDLTGQQVDEAKQTLEGLGFNVQVKKILGGYFQTVRTSDPQPGTSVPKGSTVTVTII